MSKTPQENKSQNPELTKNPTAKKQNENESKQDELYSLALLADKFRVPSWQEAALLRMMEWTTDKKVSENEYKTALGQLSTRRIGGGRN